MVYFDVVIVVVVVDDDDDKDNNNNDDQSFQVVDISCMSCTVWKTAYKRKKKRTRDLKANYTSTERFINAEPNTIKKMT